MEILKSLVPDRLKQRVTISTSGDLLSSSSSLVDFLLPLQEFQFVIEDLADPRRALCAKNKDAAVELKQKGNRCYSSGSYSVALSYYSKALRVAPLEAEDKEKDLVSVLYVNRAAVLYKLDRPVECKRDCDRALRSSPSYAKAWYWRGKANAALEDYGNAVSDLKIANFMETSSAGKKQIESELLIDSEKLTGGPSSLCCNNDDISLNLDEKCEVELECVVTPDKGRGMVSKGEVPPSSLVHIEEPYAAVILKQSRDSNCHYCFDELPADPIPCTLCSIPLYCSENCQVKAGGRILRNRKAAIGNHGDIPRDLKIYIEDVTTEKINEKNLGQFQEHEHECSGANWAAVLPPELVLAGRIIVKALQERGDFLDNPEPKQPLDVCYSYSELPIDTKLESHIYSILLLCCLQRCCSFEIPVNAVSVSRTIILFSQIKVNSMAVVRMKSSDFHCLQDPFGKDLSCIGVNTSSIEQVKVGQAIYARGSLFNHSCKPNIHIYFLSRNLYIRSTEQVSKGHPLELSYGPQTGQRTCQDRLKFLKEEYSFQCRCSGCSTLNLSDLALNAFHCTDPDCNGIVIETEQVYSERNKSQHSVYSERNKSQHSVTINPKSLEPYLEIENLNNLDFEPRGDAQQENVGYCLKCRSYCDLRSPRAAADKAWANIGRLQDKVAAGEMSGNLLHSASESLHLLRLRLHSCNKRIAEAEDILAQAFCMIGDFQSASNHCCASIEILEKLYGPDHIAIGYELLKLLSIKMGSGYLTHPEIADRLGMIFNSYYGPHADKLFPYLRSLRREIGKSAS
ncbi:SET and MYND domain-containing protein 4 [Punica granatum]|uniref:Uncharacterized protein n=2 Tax=Punica granatum TaxID=22663 RepID=A0A2I0L6Z4_PUNGR|nr:SET and MYND domain-containing protein 4 [Punica granatum]PKI76469.1 hypothetical protein CRG98_003140 [Punica granatum]